METSSHAVLVCVTVLSVLHCVVVVDATYCVISSLVLLHRLRSVLSVSDVQLVVDWCVSQLNDIVAARHLTNCRSAFCLLASLTVSRSHSIDVYESAFVTSPLPLNHF